MELSAAEYKRRYTLVRKWYERGYKFLEEEVQRHGVPTLEVLPEHPRFSTILKEIMGALLDRNWKWYFVVKLVGILGCSYDEIVAELPDIFWKTKADIFGENNGGGENGEEPK
jgi:hypothetical protein